MSGKVKNQQLRMVEGGTIAVVIARGEIALGLEHKGKQFVVEMLASGDILLRRNSTFKVDMLVGGEASIIRTFVDSVGKKTTSRTVLQKLPR